MERESVKSLMDQADQLLQNAKKQMYRPKEDVIPQLICSNARQSIAKYLSGYLLNNGIENIDDLPLDELLNKCQEINPNFKGLSLDDMNCRSEIHDSAFCTDMRKVEACVDLATEAKKMIESNPRPSSKPWPLSRPVK